MAEKILFPVFINNIINSFPYAVVQLIFYGVALVKCISHSRWKYEPQHRNLNMVTMLWFILPYMAHSFRKSHTVEN